ncbi:MAG: hypothetical protein R3F24_03880 [Gammaproteobacteria bacterium]
MKSTLIAAIAVLALSPLAASAADGAGHCNYVQQNMFAGPFKVCDAPTDAAKCTELGKTDDNSSAVYADGACATEGRVGVCDMGDAGTRTYYEGDPGGLEIGCGFQGGEWKTG